MPDRPVMNALEALNVKVRHAFGRTLHDASWGNPQLMSKALQEVSIAFDTPYEAVSRKSLAYTLASFRKTGSLPTFLDLKYACLGITHPLGPERWRLIEDHDLFPLLLAKVTSRHLRMPAERGPTNGKGVPRRFLKCYQALLSGYFAYNIHHEDATEQGRENWKALRTFLHDHLSEAAQATPMPRWVKVLLEHRNFLSDDIYGHYGEALAQGNYHDLKSACECLLIPRDSWVWEVTVLARVKALCVQEDDAFKSRLDQCLALVSRTSGSMLSEIVRKQCLALLVSRYAACVSQPEHAVLLDAAIALIGNPWANRAAWDAFVKDERAREVMASWLKRRLIRGFFGILSDGSHEDGMRLRSWLRVESRIDDLWVALGPFDFNHAGAGHEEYRKIAGERLLELEHGEKPETNALIMRIDDHVFVELNTSGHTCMVFRSSSLPFDLDRKWVCIGTKTGSDQIKCS